MHVLKEKEIALKRPIYACVSAIMDIEKITKLRALAKDKREDDIYLKAEDGYELPPPMEDNIGRERAVDKREIIAKNAVKDQISSMLLSLSSKTMGGSFFNKNNRPSRLLSHNTSRQSFRSTQNANGANKTAS